MNFLFPIAAAVLQACSFTLDKTILSFRRVDYRTYSGISFPLIFLITLSIFFVIRPPLDATLFSGRLSLFLLISLAIITVSNLVFYRALKSDQLSELETISLLRNIPVIIFSSIIFVDERNFTILIPALIASAAVIWSHWERHHFKMAKDTLPFMLWSLAAAPMAASLSKVLLEVWHPVSLELVRSGGLALILGPLFFKNTRSITPRPLMLLFMTSLLTSVAWILFYFSYQRSGVVYTVLLFSLQPILVYFTSTFLLKEKISHKKTIAFVIILCSIAAAQVL